MFAVRLAVPKLWNAIIRDKCSVNAFKIAYKNT